MAARQRKTPRQRAEEALAVAKRKRDRLLKQVATQEAELAAAKSDLAEAERRLTYAQQDPALPTAGQPTTPQGDDTV